MKPLVSVCIPAYNNAAYIKDTVMSILEQTYQNIELVVVDDCSTDNTVEVLETIQDERLKIYKIIWEWLETGTAVWNWQQANM